MTDKRKRILHLNVVQCETVGSLFWAQLIGNDMLWSVCKGYQTKQIR